MEEKMNFRLKTILRVTLVLFMVSIFCSALFGQADHKVSIEKMVTYAMKELPQILNMMPVNNEDQYGFKSRDEFKRAKLGVPYQEYSLQDEIPTGYWRIPVTVAGENRAMLRLKQVEGEWQFAGLGARVLAGDLGKLEKEACEKKPTSGRIIRDFEMQCDYVQYDRTPGAQPEGLVIPLKSGLRALLHLGIHDSIGIKGVPLSKIKEHRSKLLKAPAQENGTGKGK